MEKHQRYVAKTRLIPKRVANSDSVAWSAEELLKEYPPVWVNQTKARLFAEILQRPFPKCEIRATRHRTDLPYAWDRRGSSTQFEILPTAYDYREDVDSIVWHVNFADEALFAFYGSGLMAQDEWQTLEHPLLGCVREALLKADAPPPFTLDAEGVPTPFTITGVPRLCIFDAQPHVYGRNFERSTFESICQFITFPKKVTYSNVVAMCAPAHGKGTYTYEQIMTILWTGYSAFHAVKKETQFFSARAKVTICSGFWGCGAFGGNKELMALLQFIASDLAKVHQFKFYAFNETGAQIAKQALKLYQQMKHEYGGKDLVSLVDAVVQNKYQWGTSDGN